MARRNGMFTRLYFTMLLIVQYEGMGATNLSLPNDLQDWCPYTKFCHLEPYKKLPVNEAPEQDSFFCCESCSCLDDCGIDRKCCSDDLDHYRFDEKLNTICKQLAIKGGGDVHMKEYFFHIVDKCPNVSQNCNERQVAPWGSYHPNYSRTSNLIYYNKWCAECHNQTDIIPFEVTVETAAKDSNLNFITDLLFGRTVESESYLRFLPTREAYLQRQLCYPLTVRECNPRSKDYEQLSKLCQSFNATYHDGIQTYGNIYCYICSFNNKPLDDVLKKVRKNDFCFSSLLSAYNPKGTSSLTFLLSSRTTQLVKKADDTNAEMEPVWCETGLSGNENTCRRIYCPEGQFRFDDGCDFLGDTWFVQSVSVLIKLTPSSPLPLDEINDEISVRPMLHLPTFFMDWKLQLLYKASESGNHVNHFIANLRITYMHPFNPMWLLEHIDNSLREPWSISVFNTSHEVHAELDTHLGYSPYLDDKIYIPEWLSNYLQRGEARDPNVNVNESFFLREIDNDIEHSPLGNFVISRMFFCEQVELFPHEYDIDLLLVYLKSQARYLGRGSFVMLQKGDQTVYRVCLSELRNEKSNGVGNQSVVSNVVLKSIICLMLYFNLMSA